MFSNEMIQIFQAFTEVRKLNVIFKSSFSSGQTVDLQLLKELQPLAFVSPINVPFILHLSANYIIQTRHRSTDAGEKKIIRINLLSIVTFFLKIILISISPTAQLGEV